MMLVTSHHYSRPILVTLSQGGHGQLTPEFDAGGDLLEALMTTKVPPALSAAKMPTTASRELGRWMATRSPRRMP